MRKYTYSLLWFCHVINRMIYVIDLPISVLLYTVTGAIARQPHCQWSNPGTYGENLPSPNHHRIKQNTSCVYCIWDVVWATLRWRHNGHDGVSNHQPHDCLLNRLFRHRSKKTSNLRVTGLCAGYTPGTGEVPAQRASHAENVSIWWRHHAVTADCSRRGP